MSAQQTLLDQTQGTIDYLTTGVSTTVYERRTVLSHPQQNITCDGTIHLLPVMSITQKLLDFPDDGTGYLP